MTKTRQLDVSIYGTKGLANSDYGLKAMMVAQAELQYVLNNTFGDRQAWRDEGLNVADIHARVNAYAWGTSHDFSVEVESEVPFDAQKPFKEMVVDNEIPHTGDVNLLLTENGGSGLAGSVAAAAGAKQIAENEIGDTNVRESEGHIVHIEEVLHCLGFGENHAVVRELDYDDDGEVDRQVMTPLWYGGVDDTRENEAGEKQPRIRYSDDDVEVVYDLMPSRWVERASIRIPGKGWGPRGPWWGYNYSETS